jgi:hypothetical protein
MRYIRYHRLQQLLRQEGCRDRPINSQIMRVLLVEFFSKIAGIAEAIAPNYSLSQVDEVQKNAREP